MFDLSWTEMLVVAGIAIIVVGPKDLPGALRAIGRWVGRAKRMARDFQNQFSDALRDAEVDTIKKEIDSVGKIDPVAGLRKDVEEIGAVLKTEGKPKTSASGADEPELPKLADGGVADEPAPQPLVETQQEREVADGKTASEPVSPQPPEIAQATSVAGTKS